MRASAQYLRDEIADLRKQIRTTRATRNPLWLWISIASCAGIVILGNAIAETIGAVIGAVVAIVMEIEGVVGRLEFAETRRNELNRRLAESISELALAEHEENRMS